MRVFVNGDVFQPIAVEQISESGLVSFVNEDFEVMWLIVVIPDALLSGVGLAKAVRWHQHRERRNGLWIAKVPLDYPIAQDFVPNWLSREFSYSKIRYSRITAYFLRAGGLFSQKVSRSVPFQLLCEQKI